MFAAGESERVLTRRVRGQKKKQHCIRTRAGFTSRSSLASAANPNPPPHEGALSAERSEKAGDGSGAGTSHPLAGPVKAAPAGGNREEPERLRFSLNSRSGHLRLGRGEEVAGCHGERGTP